MITLRSYSGLIEASLAKSTLEVNGIACELADENANANTLAQFAIPVRLLVEEEEAPEAIRILDSTRGATSKDL